MNYFLAVLLGKTLRSLIRLVRRGGGSALPGLVVTKLWPNFLPNAISSLPDGIVIVSGSAGKSSTTHMISSILREHGKRVFTNESTANIKQGLMSAVLAKCNWDGSLSYDIAVLEVDEGHLRPFLDLKPRLAVLTNVLSDQLDRFVDPSYVIERFEQVSSEVGQVVINADDPNLRSLTFKSAPLGAGLSDALLRAKTAPTYAFNFQNPQPVEKQAIVDGATEFFIHTGGKSLATAATNAQHAINDALAVLAATQIVELDFQKVATLLTDGTRVFARNELVELGGKKVNLRLVQNPTSFQLNLDELSGSEEPLMLMAGSDIHDPSWLWTVDFTKLSKVDVVGGSNAHELALRLYFSGVSVGKVVTDPAAAADIFLSMNGDCHTVLFSADAMRRTRRHWGLAK